MIKGEYCYYYLLEEGIGITGDDRMEVLFLLFIGGRDWYNQK